MIINAISFILCSLPVQGELIQDIKHFRKGKKDKKALDVLVRSLLMIPITVVVMLIAKVAFWQPVILTIGIYVMFFDPIMGWVVKKSIFYLGETSFLDRLWKKIGPTWLQWSIRGILFAASLFVFYFI